MLAIEFTDDWNSIGKKLFLHDYAISSRRKKNMNSIPKYIASSLHPKLNFRIIRPANSSSANHLFDVNHDDYVDYSHQTTMNSSNSRTVPVHLIRKTSVDDFNERMIGMLDQVEKRVEQLRESAGQLEQEKESLINMLGNVNLDSELLRLGQGDRDDISATASRLLNRCKAVEVVVNTPRNAEQTQALNNVNNLIEAAMNKMKEDLNNAKEVIECTADDQKKIRRRLGILINQIERAQRYSAPEF
uniref:BAG domain-containing protein n=1 Tax=Elaeophora elaphi TaxID=1147741 RepID=A0A0R3RRG8_9BILA